MTRPLTTADRVTAALQMAELGVRLMEQNLRRRFPDADDAEIARRLTEWIRTRPGAEHGDGPGRRPWRSKAGP